MRFAGWAAWAALVPALGWAHAARQESAQSPPASPPPAAAQPAFRFGSFTAQIDDLAEPTDVTVTGDGTILVVEQALSRVLMLGPDGIRRGAWGRRGHEPGELLAPSAIAEHEGEVFVSDAGTHTVSVFDLSGRFKRRWGGLGDGPGQFNGPAGLAVTSDRVYVADTRNRRIQMFDRQGESLGVLADPETPAGGLQCPVDVAVGPGDRVFVVDAHANRLFVFAAGRVETWGDWGPFIEFFDEPAGVTCHGDLVIVADRRNHRIQAFDGSGALVYAWGIHELERHKGRGEIHYPGAVAIDPAGRFAVVCETVEDRCQVFAAAAPGEDAGAAPPMTNKTNQTHFGRYIDIDGNLMTIAEPENHFIFVFDIDQETPAIVNQFSERGRQYGLMVRAGGLGVDFANRRVLLADPVSRRIQAYRLDYNPGDSLRYRPHMTRFVQAIDCDYLAAHAMDPPPAWPLEPAGLRQATDGNILFVDAANDQVVEITPQWNLVTRWGGHGDQPGRFREPTDLAFSSDGETVYVVDSINARVQAFDRQGGFLFEWGGFGEMDGQFLRPFGISAGVDGFVYVTDVNRHRVQKFDERGEFVAAWSEKGDGVGQLWKPRGIAQDQSGNLYVVDQGNHRALVFEPDGQWLVMFGAGRAYTRDRPPAVRD